MALQPPVPRTIRLAHPARAERGCDFIGAKMCTWSKGHKWPCLYPRGILRPVPSALTCSVLIRFCRNSEASAKVRRHTLYCRDMKSECFTVLERGACALPAIVDDFPQRLAFQPQPNPVMRRN